MVILSACKLLLLAAVVPASRAAVNLDDVDGTCSTDLFAPTTFGSIKSCNSYYWCDNEDGSLEERQCPEGEQFSRDFGECDPTEEANCELLTAVDLADIAGDCAKTSLFLPSKSRCSNYYKCNTRGEEPVPLQCETGKEFNVVMGVCTSVKEARCGVKPEDPSFNPKDVEGECSTDLFTFAYFGSKESCSTFYRCNNTDGTFTKRECPDDLEYNRETNVCEDPEEAQCEVKSVVDEADVEGYCSTALSATTYFPSKSDCSSYYKCDNRDGTLTELECPNDQEFNEVLRVCDDPINAMCGLPPSDGPDFDPRDVDGECSTDLFTITYFGSRESCTTFYKCNNTDGSLTKKECSEGREFNRVSAKCQEPDDAQCQVITEPPPVTDPPVTEPPVTEPPQDPDAFGTCPSRHNPQKPYLLASKSDCFAFYKCGQGCLQKYFCPKWLLFNYWKQKCDLPKYTKCVSGRPQLPLCRKRT